MVNDSIIFKDGEDKKSSHINRRFTKVELDPWRHNVPMLEVPNDKILDHVTKRSTSNPHRDLKYQEANNEIQGFNANLKVLQNNREFLASLSPEQTANFQTHITLLLKKFTDVSQDIVNKKSSTPFASILEAKDPIRDLKEFNAKFTEISYVLIQAKYCLYRGRDLQYTISKKINNFSLEFQHQLNEQLEKRINLIAHRCNSALYHVLIASFDKSQSRLENAKIYIKEMRDYLPQLSEQNKMLSLEGKEKQSSSQEYRESLEKKENTRIDIAYKSLENLYQYYISLSQVFDQYKSKEELVELSEIYKNIKKMADKCDYTVKMMNEEKQNSNIAQSMEESEQTKNLSSCIEDLNKWWDNFKSNYISKLTESISDKTKIIRILSKCDNTEESLKYINKHNYQALISQIVKLQGTSIDSEVKDRILPVFYKIQEHKLLLNDKSDKISQSIRDLKNAAPFELEKTNLDAHSDTLGKSYREQIATMRQIIKNCSQTCENLAAWEQTIRDFLQPYMQLHETRELGSWLDAESKETLSRPVGSSNASVGFLDIVEEVEQLERKFFIKAKNYPDDLRKEIDKYYSEFRRLVSERPTSPEISVGLAINATQSPYDNQIKQSLEAVTHLLKNAIAKQKQKEMELN